MANHKLLFSLTQAKKVKPRSVESSSDDEAVVTRPLRAGRAPVKYYDSDGSDDKENENSGDWSASDDDDFDDEE